MWAPSDANKKGPEQEKLRRDRRGPRCKKSEADSDGPNRHVPNTRRDDSALVWDCKNGTGSDSARLKRKAEKPTWLKLWVNKASSICTKSIAERRNPICAEDLARNEGPAGVSPKTNSDRSDLAAANIEAEKSIHMELCKNNNGPRGERSNVNIAKSKHARTFSDGMEAMSTKSEIKEKEPVHEEPCNKVRGPNLFLSQIKSVSPSWDFPRKNRDEHKCVKLRGNNTRSEPAKSNVKTGESAREKLCKGTKNPICESKTKTEMPGQ